MNSTDAKLASHAARAWLHLQDAKRRPLQVSPSCHVKTYCMHCLCIQYMIAIGSPVGLYQLAQLAYSHSAL